jgi:hypothetical protein
VFFEALKNFVNDLSMFIKSSAPNEDIIQIDCNFSFGNQICENGVHQCLKHGGQIGESKEHDAQLKKALVSDKGYLPFIAFLNPDVVVAPMNIKLDEDFCIP